MVGILLSGGSGGGVKIFIRKRLHLMSKFKTKYLWRDREKRFEYLKAVEKYGLDMIGAIYFGERFEGPLHGPLKKDYPLSIVALYGRPGDD